MTFPALHMTNSGTISGSTLNGPDPRDSMPARKSSARETESISVVLFVWLVAVRDGVAFSWVT